MLCFGAVKDTFHEASGYSIGSTRKETSVMETPGHQDVVFHAPRKAKSKSKIMNRKNLNQPTYSSVINASRHRMLATLNVGYCTKKDSSVPVDGPSKPRLSRWCAVRGVACGGFSFDSRNRRHRH